MSKLAQSVQRAVDGLNNGDATEGGTDMARTAEQKVKDAEAARARRAAKKLAEKPKNEAKPLTERKQKEPKMPKEKKAPRRPVGGALPKAGAKLTSVTADAHSAYIAVAFDDGCVIRLSLQDFYQNDAVKEIREKAREIVVAALQR